MIKPEQCLKSESLVPLVLSGGMREVRVQPSPVLEHGGDYVVQITINTTGEKYYLATRENPTEPRLFKKVDVAISASRRLLGAKRFVVIVE